MFLTPFQYTVFTSRKASTLKAEGRTSIKSKRFLYEEVFCKKIFAQSSNPPFPERQISRKNSGRKSKIH